MRRRRSRLLHSLRICPVCGSQAVSTLERVDVERRRVPLALRCGECGTWRGSRVRPRVADALEEELLHDLELMAQALVRATSGARARGVHAPGEGTGLRPRRRPERPAG
jgi:hypothetical protein